MLQILVDDLEIGYKCKAMRNGMLRFSIWTFLRLAAFALPLVGVALFHGDHFGAEAGGYIALWAFFIISYGQARFQQNLSLLQVGLAHLLAYGLLHVSPILSVYVDYAPAFLMSSIVASGTGSYFAIAFPQHATHGGGWPRPRLTLSDGLFLLGGEVCGYFLFPFPVSVLRPIGFFATGLIALVCTYVLIRVVANRAWLLLVPLLVPATMSVRRWANRPPALERAVVSGDADQIQGLIRQGADVNKTDNQGDTALFKAIITGNRATVKALLDAGANPNIHSKFVADTLTVAIAGKDVEIVKLMLDHAADPNAQDAYHYTPLMSAIAGRQKEMVQILLEHGADPNIRGSDSNTPLMQAISFRQIEIVQLLLDHGADVNANTNWGTPLSHSQNAKEVDISALLRAHGAR